MKIKFRGTIYNVPIGWYIVKTGYVRKTDKCWGCSSWKFMKPTGLDNHGVVKLPVSSKICVIRKQVK